MPASASGLSLERLAVRVLLQLQAEPGRYTARSLARELGETPNRVNRVILAIEEEVGVGREGAYGTITVGTAGRGG
ncbi:hypothetical protein QOL99_16285 [Deinococcus sp. MIMF12]|uniref:MarR family transcriptional regulator n=1 Tax=Deinococcus rhizophilus TaxID=3049544 RepID=A0ABT7JM76_9DEIO|nr:hypothetical protein [Deinococcus rhizophilus]MDL2345692.1 hypothetical protein [Deinococcus rhizophilus]